VQSSKYLRATALLCGALFNLSAQSAPTVATWNDQQTGLTWTACPIGDRPNDKRCEQEDQTRNRGTVASWGHAVLAAKTATIGGFDDWRLPTIQEVLTIYKCRAPQDYQDTSSELAVGRNSDLIGSLVGKAVSGAKAGLPQPRNMPTFLDIQVVRQANGNTNFRCPPGAGANYVFIGEMGGNSVSGKFWTASPTDLYMNENDRRYNQLNQSHVIFQANHGVNFFSDTSELKYFLVRGGTPGAEWQAALNAAPEAARGVDAANAKRQMDIEKSIESERNRKRQEVEAEAKKRENFEKETARLRASVKPGDIVSKGLVLEVRGDLIGVQTYRNICVTYSSNVNPFSHRYECQKYRQEAAGNEWIKRQDIYAPLR